MLTHRRSPFVAVLVITAIFIASPGFAQEIITCTSDGYRYRYCSARTDYRVTLTRQLSGTRCIRGETWGFDRNGVWVDRGCAAEFRVGRNSPPSYPNYPSYPPSYDRDKKDNTKTVAVAGAVVGLALIAALASKNHDEKVPTWAIGTFRGYDEDERSNVELKILPGGTVDGSAGGQSFSGKLAGDLLQAGRHQFRIERTDGGFLATDSQNSRHRVSFQRSGTGYSGY